MRVAVDFVQGIDSIAPGLTRAQEPLLQSLQQLSTLDVRPVKLSLPSAKLLFPAIYGPFPLWLRARRANVVHLTNAWYAHLVPVLAAPVVVTCHDLIEWDEIMQRERAVKLHRLFHAHASVAGLIRATRVVCDSQAVASQISDRWPGAAERLAVIPLGVSPRFSPGPIDTDVLRRLGVRRPYVLYVGSEQPRKNLERTIAALGTICQRISDLQFVKVGDHQTGEGRERLLHAVNTHGLEHRTRILEQVSDEDLVALYRGAAAHVLLSLREGFGFPALEAMACGCPTVVSCRDSLPEIVDQAAVVVDPCDVQSIVRALEQVLLDTDFRDKLVHSGPCRAARFTWHRAADQYAALYEEVHRQI